MKAATVMIVIIMMDHHNKSFFGTVTLGDFFLLFGFLYFLVTYPRLKLDQYSNFDPTELDSLRVTI